ncbi:N-acetyltransferase family 8 member 3 [Cyprinodon tularosa]|uniref:N-acetyltransferase family 8 member 3 n=1 Tax=Cyprinodon tularosa TaxID=77115 RepID=UPI0018E23F59|nr:N-acetyltransferase family 8 member 3 [Cyprinodon tularosa]
MANKSDFQFSIREYRPSDQHVVMSLFHDGIFEHIYPAFFKAISNPDHVGIALSISMAGYVLGGSSYFQALLFGSIWAGFVYYCCHDIYDRYMMWRLSADMADIQASYLENPDNGFWVTEVDVNGQAKVVGMVAVMGKREEDDGERFDDLNGAVSGTEFAQDAVNRSYAQMSHIIVAFSWRRKNLGSQLTRRALDFCKERGFSRLIMDVSSPQTAAISMCQKLGFVQTGSLCNTHANRWFYKLARITVKRMERSI